MTSKQPKKLLIFDVDGTLLMNGNVVKEAFKQAYRDITESELQLEGVVFAGMTDRGIFRQLLQAGRVEGDYEALYAAWKARFTELMEQRYHLATTQYVLPGVFDLLERLAKRDDVCLALGTGNVRETCYIKLRHLKLDRFFPIGGFGGDHELRPDVIRAAVREAREICGWDGDVARDAWVIGDTPNDVSAAKANGMRVLAVASGIIDRVALEATDADVVLDDLRETDHILSILDLVSLY